MGRTEQERTIQQIIEPLRSKEVTTLNCCLQGNRNLRTQIMVPRMGYIEVNLLILPAQIEQVIERVIFIGVGLDRLFNPTL